MADFKAFTKGSQSDNETSTLQRNVDAALGSLAKSEIINGVLIENVLLETFKVTLVPHRLGRKYKGYIVVKNGTVSASIYTESTVGQDDSIYVPLRTNSQCTVSLWVF